jgi:hypothetical protein
MRLRAGASSPDAQVSQLESTLSLPVAGTHCADSLAAAGEQGHYPEQRVATVEKAADPGIGSRVWRTCVGVLLGTLAGACAGGRVPGAATQPSGSAERAAAAQPQPAASAEPAARPEGAVRRSSEECEPLRWVSVRPIQPLPGLRVYPAGALASVAAPQPVHHGKAATAATNPNHAGKPTLQSRGRCRVQ